MKLFLRKIFYCKLTDSHHNVKYNDGSKFNICAGGVCLDCGHVFKPIVWPRPPTGIKPPRKQEDTPERYAFMGQYEPIHWIEIDTQRKIMPHEIAGELNKLNSNLEELKWKLK